MIRLYAPVARLRKKLYAMPSLDMRSRVIYGSPLPLLLFLVMPPKTLLITSLYGCNPMSLRRSYLIYVLVYRPAGMVATRGSWRIAPVM